MKNINKLLSIATLGVLFTSCDKINDPVQNATNQPEGPVTQTLVRKVMMEDYSGHKCGNCPRAGAVLKNLYKDNPNTIVPIVIHSGNFAKADAVGTYTYEFRTPVGNDWSSSAGFNIGAYPSGIINRKDFGGGLTVGETSWASNFGLAKNDPYILGLTLTRNYIETTKALLVDVKAKFKISHNNNVKLNVILTEDSIISPQTDYDLPSGSQTKFDYVHMYVLRASLNGSWGQTLKNTPILPNDSLIINLPSYTLDNKFVPKNISIVAFAYDEVTREVLQVEKIKLK
ncbi:MAG: Omp28-related outer membrane protein [Bacteroidetes bacterium]|nr:Omp28-related outer membrane protein [Bacteroidota bacterium]MCA6444884.1 Omp28-related outer membrane protein [Bacteroidota bacterium]